MSSGGSVANASAGESAKPPLKNAPDAPAGATPSGGTKALLKNPFADAGKADAKQTPSKDNNAVVKKEPSTDANKGETKQAPAQANKGEAKNPPAEGNKGASKEPAADDKKSEAKQPLEKGSQSVSNEPAAVADNGATKQPAVETNKGATKESVVEANKGASKDPAADGNGAAKGSAAEANKGKAAEGGKGAGPRKPFSETTAAVAYYIDEFGERKRYCGAARKRFKWLVSKGFTEEEARGLAHQDMQQLQPIWALKQNFASDDYVLPKPRKTAKRAPENDEDPPTPPTPPPPPKKKKKLRKDRTFHQPPENMKEPLGGIRVGIIAAGYPDTLLSAEQLKLLRFTVLEQLVPEKQGTFKPKFLGTSAKPGFIIFHCEDKATVLWLKTILNKLNTVVEADLRALEHYQIPRKLAIVGYFPNKKRESINKIFETIKEYNEGLNVDAWVLHKLITIKGVTQAIIAVDHQSAEKLIKNKFKIKFKKRVLELKPDVKFQKNVEVTVYIPKDPKEGTSRPWNKWWNPKLPRPPKFEAAVGQGGPGAMDGRLKGNAPVPQPGGPLHGAPSWDAAGPMGPHPGPPQQNPVFGDGPPHHNPMFGNRPPNQNPMFENVGPNQNPMFGNGPPNQNPMFDNADPNQNPMFGNGPPNQNPMFGNGPPNQNPVFGNGPPNPMFGNGAPHQNPMFGNGPPNQNPMFGNGPPNQNPMFGNGPPNQNPMLGNGPPNPMFGNGPPNQNPMFGNGPANQNLMLGNGPPNQNPMFGNGPPYQDPMFGNGPPYQNPMYGSGPPNQNPMWDNGPQTPFLAVCPPGPPQVPMTSHPGPSNMPPAPPPPNEPHFGPPMLEPGGEIKRDGASGRPIREPGFPRGNHQNFVASNEEMQLAPQNRNPTRGPLYQSERPAWDRRRDESPIRPPIKAERPPRALSGDRGFMSVADKPPRAPRVPTPEDSRPRHYSQRDSTEADTALWDPTRGRCSDRGSVPEDVGPRFARTRERLPNRGPESGAERRTRSRSRHSPDRSRRFDDRRQWPGSQDSYSGPDAERPSRRRNRDVSDSRSATEADRRPRDVSRDSFSNRESLTEAERPAYGRLRVYMDRGPGIEADLHPQGPPQDHFNRGLPNEVPPRGMSAQELSNRAASPDIIRRPWDRPQENYQGSERDAARHPRSRSRENPNRVQAVEVEGRPWAMSRERFSNRNEANEAERIPRDASRDRFSNRGSTTEDDRWGVPREESLIRGGSVSETSRAQWGTSRDSPPRGRLPERRPLTGPVTEDDAPPWVRQDNVINESDRPEWALSRSAAAEGSRRQRSASREGFRDRKDNRPPWAESEDTFGRRSGREIESRGPQWGSSEERFSSRPSVGADNSTRDRSRENFPNRDLAKEVDERPPWAQTRDSVSNRGPTVELVSYPLPSRFTNMNRNLPVEANRQHWGTSRDDYKKLSAAIDQPPRDSSRETFSKAEGERSQWGPSRESYSSRGSANEGGRPPWVASRDTISNRESTEAGNRPTTTPGDGYPNRGSNREAEWSSSRDFPVEADSRARGAPGGGYSNRGEGTGSRTALSRDRFSRDAAAPDRPPRERSRERYPKRGSLPEPDSSADPGTWPGRNPQRGEHAREFRERFSGADDRRPADNRDALGGSLGALGRGGAEARGSRRDPPAAGPAREQQGWSDRPTRPGPHRGSAGGGRFH